MMLSLFHPIPGISLAGQPSHFFGCRIHNRDARLFREFDHHHHITITRKPVDLGKHGCMFDRIGGDLKQPACTAVGIVSGEIYPLDAS